jgi:tetratricopeptide (TPR) repeat protein
MKAQRKLTSSPLGAFAPWFLCVRLFIAGAPTTFCLLLTVHSQLPSAVSAPIGQVSKQASDLILQAFELLGEHDAVGAEKAFRQAIEVQPEVEAAHRGLGLALREEGRLAEAFRELQTATQLNPSDSDAHYTLGSVAWALSMPANTPPGKKGA